MPKKKASAGCNEKRRTAAKKKAAKKKKGRPAGAETKDYPFVESALTRCPKPSCRSTDRGPYCRRQVFNVCGVNEGEPFNLLVHRWTRCATCGQVRVDFSFEFIPDLLDRLRNGDTEDDIADEAGLTIG